MPPSSHIKLHSRLTRAARVGALLLSVSALGGCSRAVRAPEADLVILLESAPLNLDPRLATDQAAGRVLEMILSGLVTKNPNGDFVPDLAESWEILDDATRYRFHLRGGVRFHDGRQLSAADVAWTYTSMIDGTVVTPKRGALPQLERVEPIDALTVDFHLSEPYGALIANLTSFLGIIPLGMLPDEFNRQPVGSGPYRLVERAPDRLSLAAFDGFWGDRASIDTVLIRTVPDATVRALELKKGSGHLVVNGLPPDVVMTFRDNPAFRLVEDPGSNYSYLGVNLQDRILSSPDVRRAIALGIERDLLISSIWRGLAVKTETLLRPGHWARNDEIEPVVHDPPRARALLDRAGFPDPDGDGPEPRFRLVYKTSTDETALLQAQVIQSMLAEVGIGIDIRSYEFATFYNDIKRGNFQIFSLTWTGIVDPDIYSLILHSDRIPPAGSNRGRYRNPTFDALIEAGARASSRDARRAPYLEAQQILARDLPYISLFIKANAAIMPQGLTGYRNYPSGEFYGIKDLSWAED